MQHRRRMQNFQALLHTRRQLAEKTQPLPTTPAEAEPTVHSSGR